MTTKGRSLPVALLGVLVLACVFVSPAAATALGGPASAATVPTVRGLAPLGIGQRESRDHPRALTRQGGREQSRLAVVVERSATSGQGPYLFGALLGPSILAVALVAGFLIAGDRTVQVPRRMPGTRRDRAPPALAVA